jgi:alpha-tubulin suppressor-like RCC1 family protein
MLLTRCSLAAVALLLAACNEERAVAPTPKPPGGYIAEAIQCTVHATQGAPVCNSVGSAVASSRADAIAVARRSIAAHANADVVVLGGQNVFVRLSARNPFYDPGNLYQFEARVQNLTGEPMGTADGVTFDGVGVDVFFSTLPAAPVDPRDALTGTFTDVGQRYFNYPQLVPANASTAWQNWLFLLHGVTNFTFVVFVSTQMAAGVSTIVIPPHQFTSIATGYEHSCAIRSGGLAYCWGSDLNGMLGDGATVLSDSAPRGVLGEMTFRSVYPGGDHTCALDAGGVAYCWGANDKGQIGDSTTTPRPTPTLVAGGHIFDTLSMRGLFTCGRLRLGPTERKVLCWGRNLHGQTGNPPSTLYYTYPVPPVIFDNEFVDVTAGDDHVCAIKSNTELWCWGDDSYGEIGSTGDGGTADTPRIVPGIVFSALSAGSSHTCGIETATKLAYCWGYGGYGGLGNGANLNSSSFVAVSGGLHFSVIASGGYHTCALEEGSGNAWCWGSNFFGELGDGTTTNSNVPVAVAGPVTSFVSITASVFDTCAITVDNVTYCWGNDDLGQLGRGPNKVGGYSALPVPQAIP